MVPLITMLCFYDGLCGIEVNNIVFVWSFQPFLVVENAGAIEVHRSYTHTH